jgi:cell division protease FtsH
MFNTSTRRRGAASRVKFLFQAVFLASLVLLGGCRTASDIPYSEFKAHVAADEVAEVRFGVDAIEAVPTPAARRDGAPESWTTQPVAMDSGLVGLLETHHVRYRSAEGWPSMMVPVLLALFGAVGIAVLAFRVSRIGPARGSLGFGRSRVRDANSRSTTRFQDVAGVAEAKEELEEIVTFLREPSRFSALGARTPKGVLLVGPPGTGKTLLARAVAGEANVPFFPVSGSDFVEVYVGVGAQRVRKLFAQAKVKAPAILFIDELDAIGKSRTGGSGGGANDEREHTLNQLLVEMDGFNSRDGLIVIAATNRADTLDAALLRPGRFDRQVLVDRPDSAGREEILRVHARKLKLGADADLVKVARRTAGMAGADLENVLNEAALLAARRERQEIGMFEIDAAIDRVVAGLERKGRVTSEKERKIVAYHESGHALVAELAPTADPVRKVSIVPRGLAALGYMQQTPDDRHLLQEDELMDRLAVLLGGRAAEHVVFGKLSTGASNDLERATDLARRMVCEFGMSEVVGPVSFQSRDGRDRFGDRDGMSEQVTARIEAEVQALLSRAFDRACRELSEHRPSLDVVASSLLDQGTLDREELLGILSATREVRGAHACAE